MTGQISVVASVDLGVNLAADRLFEVTQQFLQKQGRIFAFIRTPDLMTGALKAIVEFCNSSHAVKVITKYKDILTPEVIDQKTNHRKTETSADVKKGVRLSFSTSRISHVSASSSLRCSGSADPTTRSSIQFREKQDSPASHQISLAEGREAQQLAMYPLFFQSPMMANVPYVLDSLTPGCNPSPVSPIRTLHSPFPILSPLYHAPPSPALTVQNNYSPSRAFPVYMRADGRRHNATRVTRSLFSGPPNHHNYVDINRIRDGIDVRTTVSSGRTLFINHAS